MDQRRDLMKMNFGSFQAQKWISQTIRGQRVDKKWGHLSIFLYWSSISSICLSSRVIVLKSPKILHFLQVWTDSSTGNLNLLKQFIYIHLKDLHHALSENVMFYKVRALFHKVLRNKISKRCWLIRNSTKLINFKC